MPKIPQFGFKEEINGKSLPYDNVNVDKNVFGYSKGESLKKLAKGIEKTSDAIYSFKQKADEVKIFEAYNSLNQWCQDNLYNSENGYFTQTGKAAMEQYDLLNSGLDDCVADLKKNCTLSLENQYLFKDIIGAKQNKIKNILDNYNLQQTNIWANDTVNQSLENSINSFVQARDNDDEMQQNIGTISNILEWLKNNNNLNDDEFEALKKDTFSKMNCSILDAYISEGSPKAIDYFIKNKNDMNLEQQNIYQDRIEKFEFNRTVEDLSDRIINSKANLQEAIVDIDKIIDKKVAEYVKSKVKSHFVQVDNSLNLAKQKLFENFYNNYYLKNQLNNNVSYMDIPSDIKGDDRLSLMNFINKNGNPDSDSEMFSELFQQMSENPKEFAKFDLNQKRGYLSGDIYNLFLKKQQLLDKTFSSTQLKDEYLLISKALDSVKIDNSIPPNFRKIKNKVREYGALSGENVSDNVLKDIISNLGLNSKYIDKYREINENLNKKMEIICDIFNDFEFYQEGGSKLSFDEKERIVESRIKNYKALNS